MKKLFHAQTLPRIILITILMVAIVFRFKNTPDRYGFDYDATRDALIAVYGAQTLQLPLHGPPSALGDFHFGPWYYYQLILFQLVIPLQYAPWISVSLLSILGVFFMYKLGKTIGDWKLGGIVALLSAISPAQIIASTGLSNPDMIFVCCAFVLWIFAKACKEKLPLWLAIVWGLVLGIGINYHYQMATFLLFPVILLFAQKVNRFRFTLSVFIGGLLSLLPIFIFNVQNQWHTVQGLLFYFTQGKNAVYIPNSWTIYLRDFWPEFWAYTIGVEVIVGLVIGILSAMIIGWSIGTRKIEKSMVFIIIAFVIQFLYLRYHSGSRESYYLLFLHPFIFTFVGYAIWKIMHMKKGMILASVVLLALVVTIIPQSIAVGHEMQSHKEYKADVAMLKAQYPGQSFAIYDCGRRDRNRSQAYAFLLYYDNLLQADGVPIGVYDDSCYDEETKQVVDNQTTLSTEQDPALQELKSVDLSEYSAQEILDAGWTQISPEAVYERELE